MAFALALPFEGQPFVDSTGRLTVAGRAALEEMRRRLVEQIDGLAELETVTEDDIAGLAAHIADVSNPHAVTAAQIGAQPVDATLTALAGADWAANALPIGSGADTVAQVSFAANTFPARASTGNLVAKTITDFALTLLDDTTAANARTTLGAGTVTSVNLANSTGLTASGGPITGSGSLTYTLSANLQAWHGLATSAKQDADPTLTALAAANWAANAIPIGTGADTLAQTTFAANTFPARASTGNLVAKTITDDALALLADADVPRLGTVNTWATTQTFTVAPVFTDAAGTRTALGATTVGGNFFTLANPSAITFPRINADNSVSALSAADLRSAIGVASFAVPHFVPAGETYSVGEYAQALFAMPIDCEGFLDIEGYLIGVD